MPHTHSVMNSPNNPKCPLKLASDWAQFIFPGVDKCLGFKAEGLHGKEVALGLVLGAGDVGFCSEELRLAWGSSRKGMWPPRGQGGAMGSSQQPSQKSQLWSQKNSRGKGK